MGDRSDGGEQLARRQVLARVPKDSDLERLRDVLLVCEHAERQDSLLRLPAQDLARHADAAGRRERDVEEENVGLRLVDEGVGVLCLAGLSHELEVRLRREERPHPLAKEPMIIHQGEFDRHGHRVRVLPTRRYGGTALRAA